MKTTNISFHIKININPHNVTNLLRIFPILADVGLFYLDLCGFMTVLCWPSKSSANFTYLSEGKVMKRRFQLALLASASLAFSSNAFGDDAAAADNATVEMDTIVIVGSGKTYSAIETTESMALQQAPITSVLGTVDNLPGVSINEGDAYGFDDWSTSLAVRGFQNGQIGLTIDGLPNGGSGYGGGSKANRYIDPLNLQSAEVSQGTSDIASRSNEALGGTINFQTQSPEDERRTRIGATVGEHDARGLYARYDTGLFLNDTTKAWISASTLEATDFLEGSAENEKDHFAAKIESQFGGFDLTGYVSYDDAHEDNYQRIYSAAQFEANPNSDGLTGVWTATPAVDQNYRRAWSTLRENFFAYAKLGYEIADGLDFKASVYRHDQDGRGDWAPPYLLDMTGAVTGTPFATYSYVGADGLAADAGDADASPVQSYRHTHYQKERTGLTADIDWAKNFGSVENTVRAGIWYEDATRYEYRDWHQITDANVGFEFNVDPYFTQYNRDFPQSTFKWYIEDTVQIADFKATIGLKQFKNEVERKDNFDPTSTDANFTIEPESDVLLSGGLSYAPSKIAGLEVYVGYAENYKAISDDVLETLVEVLPEPETSETIEAGVRYNADRFSGSAVFFKNDFENRLTSISLASAPGEIDYLEASNGGFANVGGIESQGFELAGTFEATDNLSFYASYTNIDAKYLGIDASVIDPASIADATEAEITDLVRQLNDNANIWEGNPVAGIADNMFVLSADWQIENFMAGVSAKYTGERHVNVARDFVTIDADGNNVLPTGRAFGTFDTDANTVVDLYVGMNAGAFASKLDGVNLRLNVNNLFDESYLGTIAANSGAWLGAPRTVALSMTADF